MLLFRAKPEHVTYPEDQGLLPAAEAGCDRAAVGTQPGFPAPQPGMEASSAARPGRAAGGKGGQAAAR